MEGLLIVLILIAFGAATLWDSLCKDRARRRLLARDPTVATAEGFLPEIHRPFM